ncbi:uncharacterized protein [Leptinotarsa decemlineata]|uniref:uncharacterized protein n=1 Tax=Leptinotarsa decemlineata TaxID=7539 RepID=UPI003D30854F
MSKRTEKILNLTRRDESSLLFLPEYETTKGLQTYYRNKALRLLSLPATVKGELKDVYDFIDKEETGVQLVKKQNIEKPNEKKEKKIVILEDIQIKPPLDNTSKEILETYSPLRNVAQRKRQPSEESKENYDIGEMEEPFQSSGSEYLPSSDDEENEEFPLESYERISKAGGKSTKKTKQNININNSYKSNEISTTSTLLNQNLILKTTSKHVDPFIVNFGKFVEPSHVNVESHLGRSQDKKTSCPYCLDDVTHFARHLIRRHCDEGAVKEFSSFPPNHHRRKLLLDAIRRQGNFVSSLSTNNIRPVRRPKEAEDVDTSLFVSCPDCMGFFKRMYLRRHRKQCPARSNCKNMKRENHLSLSQVFTVCSGVHGDFLASLRLKKEVFPIMRSDEISRTAMKNMLICSYAESLLRKHKRAQIRNVISNKMRELGRLLMSLRSTTGIQLLFDALKPQYFDNIVGAVRVISGYCERTKSFQASSLALHMGTTLKQVCDIATKNIIKKSPIISCANAEESLKDIKRLKNLIENHWTSEISSLALKHLKEINYATPKLLPLTQDVMKFQTFVMNEANEASDALKKNIDVKLNYRKLIESVLALTLLINRKRIGEIQYLKTETYNLNVSENQQTEFLDCLSTEQTLCKNYKRVVTGGKGSRPVAILFPPDLQKFIELLLSFRSICVPEYNPYLFGNPNTELWLSGYHIVKKMATKANVTDTSLFTSTRLRKQIATVLQAISIKDDEMEQFATFMGHTKKTHESYYRLPQDLYQTAKVSKLLIAINSGQVGKYKGKSLDEITLSDNESLLDETETEKPLLHDRKQNDSENEIEETWKQELREQVIKNADLDKRENNIRKGKRGKWNSEQKNVLKNAFKEHIKNKKAPRKEEAELVMKKHKDLFKDKTWATVKVFVYKC